MNEQFAIDLVAEEPVVVITGNHTWCDGGELHAGSNTHSTFRVGFILCSCDC